MRLLAGSPLVAAHDDATHGVQDAYSLRCHPQVIGAARDTLDFAVADRRARTRRRRSTIRSSSATGGSSRSAISTANRSLSPATSSPSPLPRSARSRSPGSTACWTQALARPARLPRHQSRRQLRPDDCPVHRRRARRREPPPRPPRQRRSHGDLRESGRSRLTRLGAARNLRQVLANVTRSWRRGVCAAQAIDLRAPLLSGPAGTAALALLRTQIAPPGDDRYLAPDLAAAETLVRTGQLRTAVGSVIGPLE